MKVLSLAAYVGRALHVHVEYTEGHFQTETGDEVNSIAFRLFTV